MKEYSEVQETANTAYFYNSRHNTTHEDTGEETSTQQ